MATTLEQFVTVLRRSGLLSPPQLEAIRVEIGEGFYPDPPALAAALEDRGDLTSWQAEKLLSGADNGFILGKHKLLRLIASGSMSTVYEAEHVHLHRRVALKVLPRSLVGDGSFLERFYREARAVARLDHPNIVRGFDIDQEGEHHYLVMEFVEGSSLQQLVDEHGPLSFEVAAEMIRQAAMGLEHVRGAGLVHRDIKPANLLRELGGTVKIVDLGLVRSLRFENDNEAGLTKVHDEGMLGTVDYLSPEQAIDCHDVDIRSDIYSLGCAFYFLLCASPPFCKGTLVERLLAHQNHTPTPLALHRPEIPPSLAQIIEKMMNKRPEDRYQVPGEVADVLGEWLRNRREGHDEPVGEAEAPAKSQKAGRGKDGRKPSSRKMVATASKKSVAATSRSDSHEALQSTTTSPVGIDEPTARSLPECWRRWANVVETLDSWKGLGHKITDNAYRAIYHELLQACRVSFVDADDPTRLVLRKIEDLVAPWPTLRSLRSILRSQMNDSIRMQFDEIDRSLRRRVPFFLKAFLFLIVVAGASGLIYWLFPNVIERYLPLRPPAVSTPR